MSIGRVKCLSPEYIKCYIKQLIKYDDILIFFPVSFHFMLFFLHVYLLMVICCSLLCHRTLIYSFKYELSSGVGRFTKWRWGSPPRACRCTVPDSTHLEQFLLHFLLYLLLFCLLQPPGPVLTTPFSPSYRASEPFWLQLLSSHIRLPVSPTTQRGVPPSWPVPDVLLLCEQSFKGCDSSSPAHIFNTGISSAQRRRHFHSPLRFRNVNTAQRGATVRLC